MNELNKQRELLSLVWKFHQILNTAWPKPSVPQMAGSSVFIGTNLFKTLENGLSQIKDALISCEGTKKEMLPFWNSFSDLFFKIGMQNRFEKSVRIDEALNLLYLASGILYHRIREITSASPQLHAHLSDVEDVGKLLQACGWTSDKTTIKEIENELIVEMKASVEKLS